MQIHYDYQYHATPNEGLDQKMKAITSYDDFVSLAESYNWVQATASFDRVFGFNEKHVDELMMEAFYDEFLFHLIEARLDDYKKYNWRTENE